MTMLETAAATDARIAARRVRDGELTAEAAGDLWLAYADASHEAGEAFLHAYDAAGGVR